MKIVFLDIDGVLNSRRTALAFKGYPHKFEPGLPGFDPVAVGLVRKLVEHTQAQVVLSSSWRFDEREWVKAGPMLGLPIIDRTPVGLHWHPDYQDHQQILRGHEIKHWLSEKPEVSHYVILDDDQDMLEEQQEQFVHVNRDHGLSADDFYRACTILGRDPLRMPAPARTADPED